MTAYILQAILFQLLFLLVYEFLLKKETFFTYNRWYLLATSILSLLLPMVKIGALAILIPAEAIPTISTIWLPEVFIGEAPAVVQPLNSAEAVKNLKINWWLVAYATGAVASLFIFIRKYWNLNRMLGYRTISAEKNIRIIEVPDSSIACTFYKTVFIGENLTEIERQHILSHELVHVKQKHSLDLIFFEVLKVIFWFNPLIYIYQSRIATVHEFIADAAVVEVTEKRNYYEQLLNSAFNTQNISFINQFFNHSLTRLNAFGKTFTFGSYGGQVKKRIVMLQRSRSKSISKVKYLLMVPLMLLMLTYVACSSDKTIIEDSISQIKSQEDEALKASLWEEIKKMDQRGAAFMDIYNAFFVEQEAHIKTKEGFYRNQTYLKFIMDKAKQKRIEDGTYDAKKDGQFEDLFKQTYAEYVERQKDKTPVKISASSSFEESVADIPFAVVEQVPVFPGCESLGTNEERKKCMADNINKYVTTHFNTNLGKELGLKGVNRVITVFKISPEGNIADIRARAPHPDLEAEAIRVVGSLPKMKPGVHNGNNVGVSYALPIVFQVNE